MKLWNEARERESEGDHGPVRASLVERREAPHPYVTGVRAPDRNGARRTLARFARVRIATHPAPPGAPFPLRAREKEKGKGDARRPKIKVPGRRSVLPASAKASAGQVLGPSKPFFGRRREAV